jgi:hypothetical protein
MVYIIVELRGEDKVLVESVIYQSYEDAVNSKAYDTKRHFVVPLYPN